MPPLTKEITDSRLSHLLTLPNKRKETIHDGTQCSDHRRGRGNPRKTAATEAAGPTARRGAGPRRAGGAHRPLRRRTSAVDGRQQHAAGLLLRQDVVRRQGTLQPPQAGTHLDDGQPHLPRCRAEPPFRTDHAEADAQPPKRPPATPVLGGG